MQRLALTAFFVLLTACGPKPNDAEQTVTPAVSGQAVSSSATDTGFNPQSVPLSRQDPGTFPFFNLPADFKAQGAGERKTEQKWFYPDDKVIVIEGRYYHARVHADGENWNETLILRSFDEKISALGGVKVYDGGLPSEAYKRLSQESPKFAQDLYDPAPYRYRQYFLRTQKGNIWVELGYGYNAEMIDFTVVQEAPLVQTITQITADQIAQDLAQQGKAVLNIGFDTDKATLTPEGETAVQEIVAAVSAQPDLRLSIEGHTDASGSAEHNRTLSLQRARTVRSALVKAGISESRLSVSGHGAEKPIADNSTDEGKARNRRVELIRQ